MLKQESSARWRFNVIPLRSSAFQAKHARGLDPEPALDLIRGMPIRAWKSRQARHKVRTRSLHAVFVGEAPRTERAPDSTDRGAANSALSSLEDLCHKPIKARIRCRARVPHQADGEWIDFQWRLEDLQPKLLGVLCRQPRRNRRGQIASCRRRHRRHEHRHAGNDAPLRAAALQCLIGHSPKAAPERDQDVVQSEVVFETHPGARGRMVLANDDDETFLEYRASH